MLIARPISSPSPWFSGCRQLAWKGWDRGRDSLQENVQSVPRSCHWQKRRPRKRCRRRRDGPGTWLSFGIAHETGSITSVPFGEKENFRDVSPRVPARGPRRAPLPSVSHEQILANIVDLQQLSLESHRDSHLFPTRVITSPVAFTTLQIASASFTQWGDVADGIEDRLPTLRGCLK
jgi:hypothetical protein